MTFNEILFAALTAAATALGAWLGKKVSNWLDKNIQNKETKAKLENAYSKIKDVVKAGYQTYISALKDQNLFDKEAQKKALNAAVEAVMVSLPFSTQEVIVQNFGDVRQWITDKIESCLYDLKNNPANAE